MPSLTPGLLIVAGAAVEHVSLNGAAWARFADRGMVSARPIDAGISPAVVISITDEGRAALAAANLDKD